MEGGDRVAILGKVVGEPSLKRWHSSQDIKINENLKETLSYKIWGKLQNVM